MGTYIPTRRLPALGAYKYAGEDRSLVSKYILGPFWNWLVTQFPRTVAPNTITVSGLGLVFLNFLTLVALDYGLECGTSKVGAGGKLDVQGSFQPGRAGDRLAPVPILPNFGFPQSVHATKDASAQCIPNWIYLTWAVGLFAYQSLDAIDGKQARRTGMAGPLGELFDHGCDAINTTLECMLCCSALNAGRSYWTIASILATLSNFYLTTWEEYHTGVLFLSAFSGPVEGILMICVIYFITGLLPGGPSFWDRGILSVTGLENIPAVSRDFAWLNFPLNDAFMTFAALGLGANVVASYGNVARARSKRGESALTPVLGLLPLVAQLGAMVAWATANDAAIMADAKAFLPFTAAWGLLFAYTVGILIVSHVTKAPFPYWNLGMVLSALGAIDARLPSPIVQSSPLAIRTTVYALLGVCIALYLFFAHDVIATITTYTGKPCFSVVLENLDKVDDPYVDAGKKKKNK